MTNSIDRLIAASTEKRGRLCALAMRLLLAGSLSPAAVALAQDAQQPSTSGPAAQAAPAPETAPPAAPQAGGMFPPQPPPAIKRGILNNFGDWLDDTRGKFEEFKKRSDDTAQGAATATQDVMKNAADATKDAAAAIVKLPNMRVIEVHERCPLAPNGAPDCRAAATNVCRGKGFSAGKPLGVQSSENCPAAVVLSGRSPAAGECPVETVILLVACQ